MQVMDLEKCWENEVITANSTIGNEAVEVKIKVEIREVGEPDADMIDRENFVSPQFIFAVDVSKFNNSLSF